MWHRAQDPVLVKWCKPLRVQKFQEPDPSYQQISRSRSASSGLQQASTKGGISSMKTWPKTTELSPLEGGDIRVGGLQVYQTKLHQESKEQRRSTNCSKSFRLWLHSARLQLRRRKHHRLSSKTSLWRSSWPRAELSGIGDRGDRGPGSKMHS